ncbi:MAG: ferredoxin reductase, partial [Acidobacteria bacterium]|nr:ferredoxin reductase [Acidobacteriota bacterium]
MEPLAPSSTTPLLSAVGGLTNLFAWPLRGSDYVSLVSPSRAGSTLSARIVSVRDEAPGARTLTLRPSRAWRRQAWPRQARPRAGQYVSVGVFVDGRRMVRTYSISSGPERTDGCIEITVKAIPGGRVSTHLVRRAAPGDLLSLGLPQGDFVLPERPGPTLFVTAGSGITPVMGMLRSLGGQARDVVHLHYAPSPNDVIFGRELRTLAREEAGYRLELRYVEPDPGRPKKDEPFHAAQLEAVCPDWRNRETFACGPEPLLASLRTHWDGAGLAERLHMERFGASFSPAAEGTKGGRVTFTESRVETLTTGDVSLLEEAETAGLAPVHGCRIGICHTCTATLVSGCVRDLRTGLLTNEAGTRVQIC